MSDSPKTSEREIAELIAQLSRVVYGEGFAEGLTPAQWTALRYFSCANRFSCTVSAFAEFHATTRGTASQTVKSLVNSGYLTRRRSDRDRRSVSFKLTKSAQKILSCDPFTRLVAAAAKLSKTSRQATGHGLNRMLNLLAEEQGRKPFGTCSNCRYLSAGVCCQSKKREYQCEFVGEPLTEEEINQLCVNATRVR